MILWSFKEYNCIIVQRDSFAIFFIIISLLLVSWWLHFWEFSEQWQMIMMTMISCLLAFAYGFNRNSFLVASFRLKALICFFKNLLFIFPPKSKFGDCRLCFACYWLVFSSSIKNCYSCFLLKYIHMKCYTDRSPYNKWFCIS